jgi:Skp family chaperone for outer membrane proteins
MSRISLIAVVIFSAFVMAVPAMAQKIVVVDIDRAIAMSKAGQNMNSQLEKMSKDVQSKVDKIKKDLQGEADKLEEQKSLIAPDALNVKREELRVKSIGRQQEISSEARAIQAGGQNALKEIAEVAVAELKSLSQEMKADVVLRRESALIVEPGSDITDALTARIDKKISSVKVTPVKEEAKK